MGFSDDDNKPFDSLYFTTEHTQAAMMMGISEIKRHRATQPAFRVCFAVVWGKAPAPRALSPRNIITGLLAGYFCRSV